MNGPMNAFLRAAAAGVLFAGGLAPGAAAAPLGWAGIGGPSAGPGARSGILLVAGPHGEGPHGEGPRGGGPRGDLGGNLGAEGAPATSRPTTSAAA